MDLKVEWSPVDLAELAEEITQALRALGRGSRQGHRPSAQADFGVYTADLRGVVRTYKKRLKPAEGESVYQLALLLIGKNVTECRQVAYELISGHKAAREFLNASRVETLGKGVDNWACVDGFCCYVAGQAWREGKIEDRLVRKWSESCDLWWRRVAVVSTVALNTKSRGGKGDAAKTLEICSRLVADKEVMVQKAISWALRELVPWDCEAVEGFLEEHQTEVSARVRREVTKKLNTGKKN